MSRTASLIAAPLVLMCILSQSSCKVSDGAAPVSAAVGPATPAGTRPPWADEDLHLTASLSSQELALHRAGGMEMGSAGIHLLYPSEAGDPHLKNPALFPWPGESTVRGWGFWPAKPRYTLAYHACDALLERTSSAANVSYQSIVPPAWLSCSRVEDAATGLFSIIAHADARGLEHLRKLLEPLEELGERKTGWYGIPRKALDADTRLRAVLVVDDHALLPFDVSQAVSQYASGTITGWDFILATGLRGIEAQEILARLDP